MHLTREQMDEKINEHFAFEGRDDVNGVLSTLADDATHDVVGSPLGTLQGREAARPFYEGLFSDLSDGKVTTLRRLYGDRFVVDESLWEGRATGRPFGLDGRDRALKFRLLHVVDFTSEGQIQKEQVWLDLAAIFQQLPQDR
jgi:ketosteroid isomerase-like protein